MDNEQQQNDKRIIDVDLQNEMRQSFLDYSMSVIVARALPDVRDGLKPVHRRILYTSPQSPITSAPTPSAPCWARIIPTATPPFTTRWFVWLRISQ